MYDMDIASINLRLHLSFDFLDVANQCNDNIGWVE